MVQIPMSLQSETNFSKKKKAATVFFSLFLVELKLDIQLWWLHWQPIHRASTIPKQYHKQDPDFHTDKQSETLSEIYYQ
jgi:hypothetical protein